MDYLMLVCHLLPFVFSYVGSVSLVQSWHCQLRVFMYYCYLYWPYDKLCSGLGFGP